MRHSITIVLCVFLLAFGSVANAQDFMPLIKENAEWNVMWYAVAQPPFLRITESLLLEGDTLVEGVTYKKVMRKLSSETDFAYGSTAYYSLYGLIREEQEGKVFYQPIDQDTAYLLYDFGMNVNDTALMRDSQSPNPLADVMVRVDSIATRYIAGADRRVYYVSSKSNNGFPAEWRWLNTWIEGVGATEGLLYSCRCTNCGGVILNDLLCYHESDELLFMNPEYDTCLVDTNVIPVEFAPIGAEWYYERYYNEEGEPIGVTYDRFRSLRTVEMNGWECKEIELFQHLDCNGEINPHTEYYYITQEGKQVFEVENGERYLVYDFGKKAGECWFAPKYEDTICVQRVSYTILADGSCRNVLITTPSVNEDLYFNNIIDGIGMDYSLLPFETSDNPDVCQNGPIRCYTENELPLITSTVDCDYEVLTINDKTEMPLVHVQTMPNGMVQMGFSEALMGRKQIRIFDITGKTVCSTETYYDSCDIWLAPKPNELYIAQIIADYQMVYVKIVLK